MKPNHTTDRQTLISLAILLFLAVAFGGGGVRYGLANLVVQLTAIALLAFHQEKVGGFFKSAPILLTSLVGVSVLLPLLQNFPIPASIWTSLPGREPMAQSYALIGAENDWAQVSLDPARTWVAAIGLIVPITVLLLGWSLRRSRLIWIGWLIVLIGMINVLIGIPQVLTNGASGLFYPETPMPGVLFGMFANRNSTGVFLVSALACAALLPAPTAQNHFGIVRLSICILLIVGIILTRSRSALVLATIPALIGTVRSMLWLWAKRHSIEKNPARYRLLPASAGVGFLMICLAAGVMIGTSGRFQDTLARFEASTDARMYIWEDAAFSAKRLWPVGSGMGTFDEVFQQDESLENLSQRRAGRAHNDYLELTIEAGLPGLVILFGWLLFSSFLTLRLIGKKDVWTGLAGASILLVFALQSIVDYPARSQAMLAIVSFALVLLTRVALTSERAEKRIQT